ncbi:MAG TPA: P-loop NTPase fold protein, partial [Nitrospirota bacterium]|nr:P-loop NTPase fold protein [Nitrospirota bacterium]
MKISTFKEDLLGLEGFAEKLERFIKVEHRFVAESLVISLNAGFGAGKTTFLKMWVDRIVNNRGAGEGPLVVEVNAWNDDYCGDPLLSLVSALIEALNKKGKASQSLRDAAKDVAWFLTGIGSQVVSKLTGIDAVAAGELAEKKKAAKEGKQQIQNSLFDTFGKKKKALQALKAAIRDVAKGDNPSILILVDELDRCRPDYAISYLETIKHIFDIHGIVFILAVDRKQLECAAKASFGIDLDFPEYYRKFVQREVAIPTPNEQAYGRIAAKYVDYYLQRERYCFMQIDSDRV